MANGPDNTMQDLIRLQSMLPTAQAPTALFGMLPDVNAGGGLSLMAAAPKVGDGKVMNVKPRGGKFFDKLLKDMGFSKEAFANTGISEPTPAALSDVVGGGAGGSFASMVGGSRGGDIELG